MGCCNIGYWTTTLAPGLVSFDRFLGCLPYLTDLAILEELYPAPIKKYCMSTRTNIMAALKLLSACKKLRNG
jgi:hypothetical protein